MIQWLTDPEFLTDEELLAEYWAASGDPNAPRVTRLAEEILRRGLCAELTGQPPA